MDTVLYRNILKEKKITQIQLAQMTGISIDTIGSILTGRIKNPRIDTIKAIEQALEIENTSPPLVAPYLTENEERLLKLYRQLPETRQKTILDTVSDMVVANEKSKYA